jgi:hypothetical protein
MAFMLENLRVYQKAVDCADRIASQTETFPRGYYFLVAQLNGAALYRYQLAERNGQFTKPFNLPGEYLRPLESSPTERNATELTIANEVRNRVAEKIARLFENYTLED